MCIELIPRHRKVWVLWKALEVGEDNVCGKRRDDRPGLAIARRKRGGMSRIGLDKREGHLLGGESRTKNFVSCGSGCVSGTGWGGRIGCFLAPLHTMLLTDPSHTHCRNVHSTRDPCILVLGSGNLFIPPPPTMDFQCLGTCSAPKVDKSRSLAMLSLFKPIA